MKLYPEGTAVTLALRFVDLNGDPVSPTAVSVRVLDETGAVLVPVTILGVLGGDTEAEVTVPAPANALGATTAGIRLVEMTMATPAGPVIAIERYVLRRSARLAVLVNSFQTYEQALLLALEMPRMDGWALADDNARTAALIEAFERLTRIGYAVPNPALDIESVLDPSYVREISPRKWRAIDAAAFEACLPAPFKQAIRKAQVAESDVILNGDAVAGRRRAGLMSESVGESSMMFRPGKPLNLGVSEQALAYLTGYVDLRVKVGRA